MKNTAEQPHPVLWHPSPAMKEQSNLTKYQKWLGDKYHLHFPDYEGLWKWSVTDIDEFWKSIWDYFQVISHHPYDSVLNGDHMPEYNWFPGSRINYAEHILRHRSDDLPALIFQQEGEQVISMSWEELLTSVSKVQSFLQSKDLQPGDRIVGYLPNIPEAVIVFLAANALGVVWSCCSPDFGVNTVIERFSQIEPKLLFAVDGYRYGGKSFDRRSEVQQIEGALPTLKGTVWVPYLDLEFQPPDSTFSWNDLPGEGKSEIMIIPVKFDHPIWILYSSGTTGKPKAITHSHGGMLLEHLKYLSFHNDVHPGEHFFWFTTTGWMMWNFLQASMLVGAIPVLYDGSPAYPDLEVLWKMTEQLPIHHFGTSAPYLVALMKSSVRLSEEFNLNHLRSIGSTGAPLPPEAFDYVYKQISSEIWLCSMSGGTDVCTAFVGGIPHSPVRRGLIQGRALGCSLHGYTEAGTRVIGELGEMVIEKPMPCMPIYFWNDPDKKKYRSSYFEDFPGKWRHGDWIKIFADGSLLIQGRSDATLNRKGIRIGTAEIYNALNDLPEVSDSLILNLEKPDGSDFMPLFVVTPDSDLDESLKDKIRKTIRSKCSPRHVPDEIIRVPDIPYTLSGKKMEVPIKRILMGMHPGKSLNPDAIRNPGAIDFFEKWAKVHYR